ncbi:flagellar brake protein [Hahella sp. CR1]|uniref:flagellar brake protein n=1 Tax=Hahella sp. CR1 TaxID=2992807 RepID=UPI0024436ADC|nr:flagellar brake protein [Hahella sp. CR1]MDG9667406.1 flagellar brake protein [Hahella sp. CR1]
MGDKAAVYSPKDVEIPFEKLGLQVGDPLHLESMDQSARYHVRLIGFVPGQSVMVTTPVVDGKQLILKKDRPFTVRSVAKNKVCAFTSQIKHMALQPFAHIHLEYPKELLALQVRNAERLKVEIPTQVNSDFDTGLGDWPKEAVIIDVSKTGAGVKSIVKLGDAGEEVILRFTLTVADITKTFNVNGIIRNRTILEQDDAPFRYLYGVQFTGLSDAAKIVISGFVHELQLSK